MATECAAAAVPAAVPRFAVAPDLTDLARAWHAQGWAYTAAGRPELANLCWAHARDIEEALMGDGVTLVSLGQNLTNGQTAYGCPHLGQWWPVFTRLQILRGQIERRLDIVQAYGFSDKSAGTHAQGTATDITQTASGIVADAREAGARATWCRGQQWGQPTMGNHIHLALDCPCIAGSDYQIAAADDGYNGLGLNGRGGKDYHPAPKVRRDWQAGITWMTAEIARLNPEDTMPITTDDARLIASTTLGAPITASGSSTSDVLRRGADNAGAAAAGVAELKAQVAALQSQVAKIDPAAIAAAVQAALVQSVKVTGTLQVDQR